MTREASLVLLTRDQWVNGRVGQVGGRVRVARTGERGKARRGSERRIDDSRTGPDLTGPDLWVGWRPATSRTHILDCCDQWAVNVFLHAYKKMKVRVEKAASTSDD